MQRTEKFSALKWLSQRQNGGHKNIKKQAQRAKAGVSSSIKDTPRSKTRSMLSQSIVNPVVKKSLFFHNVLCNSIRERYHTTKSDKVRQLLASIVPSNLLRKYKLMRTCRKSTGISERRLSSSAKYKVATYSYVREPYKSKTYRLRNVICSFLTTSLPTNRAPAIVSRVPFQQLTLR